MTDIKFLITPHKYHSASLYIDDKYYPSSNVIAAGSIGTGIECIIAIEDKEIVFYQTKFKLSNRLGEIKKGDKIFSLGINEIKSVNLSLTRRGTFNWRNPEYPNGKYPLDVEIELINKCYHFEINALIVLDKFVQDLRNKHIKVVDTLNLIEMLRTINNDEKSIYDFIDKNFGELANQYHLDNPRLKIEID